MPTLKTELGCAFHSGTQFLVQIGFGPKGAYKTKYSFTGDLQRAIMHYNCINIGRGYKKRLIAPSMNRPLLARAFS